MFLQNLSLTCLKNLILIQEDFCKYTDVQGILTEEELLFKVLETIQDVKPYADTLLPIYRNSISSVKRAYIEHISSIQMNYSSFTEDSDIDLQHLLMASSIEKQDEILFDKLRTLMVVVFDEKQYAFSSIKLQHTIESNGQKFPLSKLLPNEDKIAMLVDSLKERLEEKHVSQTFVDNLFGNEIDEDRADEVFDLISNINALNGSEIVPLYMAINRVVAKDIIATRTLPAFDNSALDGYAFAYADIKNPLKIKGTILAGDKNNYQIGPNECYKIMTGAIFTNGADTVVMIENEKLDKNGDLIVPLDTPPNNARKITGEEIKSGELLLSKNSTLTPANIMLLAAQGISYVNVIKKPKIAIFSSGNEIYEPWDSCDTLSVYNANGFGIMAALSQNGFESEYKGVLKDQISTMQGWELFQIQVNGVGQSLYSPANGSNAYMMVPDVDVVNSAISVIEKMQKGEAISEADIEAHNAVYYGK